MIILTGGGLINEVAIGKVSSKSIQFGWIFSDLCLSNVKAHEPKSNVKGC